MYAVLFTKACVLTSESLWRAFLLPGPTVFSYLPNSSGQKVLKPHTALCRGQTTQCCWAAGNSGTIILWCSNSFSRVPELIDEIPSSVIGWLSGKSMVGIFFFPPLPMPADEQQYCPTELWSYRRPLLENSWARYLLKSHWWRSTSKNSRAQGPKEVCNGHFDHFMHSGTSSSMACKAQLQAKHRGVSQWDNRVKHSKLTNGRWEQQIHT